MVSRRNMGVVSFNWKFFKDDENFLNFENFWLAENMAEFLKNSNFCLLHSGYNRYQAQTAHVLSALNSLSITNLHFCSINHSLAARLAESRPNTFEIFGFASFP